MQIHRSRPESINKARAANEVPSCPREARATGRRRCAGEPALSRPRLIRPQDRKSQAEPTHLTSLLFTFCSPQQFQCQYILKRLKVTIARGIGEESAHFRIMWNAFAAIKDPGWRFSLPLLAPLFVIKGWGFPGVGSPLTAAAREPIGIDPTETAFRGGGSQRGLIMMDPLRARASLAGLSEVFVDGHQISVFDIFPRICCARYL